MRKRWSVSWVVIPVVMLGLGGWANLSLAQEKKAEPPKDKDIVDTTKAAENLKTFVKLVENAGLVEELKGKGPYTVFAPTDDAFKKLGPDLDLLMKPESKERVKKILLNHVVKGKHLAADVQKMTTTKTLGGGDVAIAFKEGVVSYGKAKVTKADVAAGNGVIHVVDTVVMPEKPKEEAKPAPKKEEPKKEEPKKEPPKKEESKKGGGSGGG